jgi:hypothetical protein
MLRFEFVEMGRKECKKKGENVNLEMGLLSPSSSPTAKEAVDDQSKWTIRKTTIFLNAMLGSWHHVSALY